MDAFMKLKDAVTDGIFDMESVLMSAEIPHG